MIYKKTIYWIREWKVLIRSKSSCWQTLILWTFCTWTKAPTFLNYMVWAGACFQDLPNHTTAIYFPNCSCQNFPDLCSVLHLQGHLVNVWHCQAAFHAMLFKLLALSFLLTEILLIHIYKNLMNKRQSGEAKKKKKNHKYQISEYFYLLWGKYIIMTITINIPYYLCDGFPFILWVLHCVIHWVPSL